MNTKVQPSSKQMTHVLNKHWFACKAFPPRCVSLEWHLAPHNNKPASFCTAGILPVFIDYATFSEKVFVFGCSEMNVVLWMEMAGSVFLNSMLLFLETEGQKKKGCSENNDCSGWISMVFLNGPFQHYFFDSFFMFYFSCSECLNISFSSVSLYEPFVIF